MTFSKSDDADGITIDAWIQMGQERRGYADAPCLFR